MVHDVLPNTATANDFKNFQADSDDDEPMNSMPTGAHTATTYPAYFKRNLAGPGSTRFWQQLHSKDMDQVKWNAMDEPDKDAWLNANLLRAPAPSRAFGPRRAGQRQQTHSRPANNPKPGKHHNSTGNGRNFFAEANAQILENARYMEMGEAKKPAAMGQMLRKHKSAWHKYKNHINRMFQLFRKEHGQLTTMTIPDSNNKKRQEWVIRKHSDGSESVVEKEFNALHKEWLTICKESQKPENKNGDDVLDAYCHSTDVQKMQLSVEALIAKYAPEK
jgi:hypothetical protein